MTADLHSVCPACGDPYVGGPGCHEGRCAATCGDPTHKPGECTDECWNPLGRDNSEAQR